MSIKLVSLVAISIIATPAGAQDWDCKKAGELPQQGMNYCAGLDFARADDELNALWPTVRAYARKIDSWQDGDLKGAAAALLKAQRAWINYRDGQCELEGFEARGGTLEPLLVATCKTRLTRARIGELKSIVQEQ